MRGLAMKKIGDSILQEFLNKLIEELKREKGRGKFQNDQVDVPFIISSLHQSFSNETDKYEEFIQDLRMYPDYNISILNSQDDYSGIIDADINLVKYPDKEKEQPYMDGHSPNYGYKLCFAYDMRGYGDCECTPDMPDYRADRHCCGHGCDASFCKFSLHKFLDILSCSWDGDEHDYWEFEDGFYLSDKELADKKREEDKAKEIAELRNRIDADQKRLAELEG